MMDSQEREKEETRFVPNRIPDSELIKFLAHTDKDMKLRQNVKSVIWVS